MRSPSADVTPTNELKKLYPETDRVPGSKAAASSTENTRYDDVAQVLKDERFAKDKGNALTPEQAGKQPWIPALFRPLTRNMLDLNAPDHKRRRALVHKAFTPRGTISDARSGTCTRNSGMSGSPSMNVPFFLPFVEKRRTRCLSRSAT